VHGPSLQHVQLSSRKLGPHSWTSGMRNRSGFLNWHKVSCQLNWRNPNPLADSWLSAFFRCPVAQLRSCQEVVLYTSAGRKRCHNYGIVSANLRFNAVFSGKSSQRIRGVDGDQESRSPRVQESRSRVFEPRLRADFCLRPSLFHISGDSLMGKLLPLSQQSSSIPPKSCDEAA